MRAGTDVYHEIKTWLCGCGGSLEEQTGCLEHGKDISSCSYVTQASFR